MIVTEYTGHNAPNQRVDNYILNLQSVSITTCLPFAHLLLRMIAI